MNRKVTIRGKALPIWLAIVLLIGSGAGAAVGTVLSGKIKGEISVNTGGSAGVFIGEPLCDTLKHTPNDANEENNDAVVNEDPTGTWDILASQISSYTNIAYPDEVYEVTAAGATVAAGDLAQQMYKVYVGPKAKISKIVATWKGKASSTAAPPPSPLGTVLLWNSSVMPAAWSVATGQNIPGTSTELTWTIKATSALTIDQAVTADGYVYLNVAAATDTVSLYTDYVSISVTYTSFDWPNWTGYTGEEATQREFVVPERCVGVHSDDQLNFEAASELGVGDWWVFALPIKNSTNQNMPAKLTLEVPSCLNVYIMGADELGESNARVRKVVRIGPNTWKLLVDAGAEKQDDNDYLYIHVNAHDDCGPGFFNITGTLEQISY